ncbi:MAG: glycosyltransferase family 4 protein [Planctomycetes bacterium]|nr:glycosyltransferase family 4 protein [Planctomycetota bacterium]
MSATATTRRMVPGGEADAALVLPPLDGAGGGRVSFGRRIRRWIARRVIRAFMALYHCSVAIAKLLGRKPYVDAHDEPIDILLTGTFYSDNWLSAHIVPLANSNKCRRLMLVTTFESTSFGTDGASNVELLRPPSWLCRVIGNVPARLMTFTWVALRRRPAWVGGFHLLFNGLIAQLVARLVGSRAMYFCVGGPMEVLGGGIWAENRVFCKLEVPDAKVEASLLRAVKRFDLIITMGRKAQEFIEEQGVDGTCMVVSGGIDAERFSYADQTRDIDFILVARLSPIKRIDSFLRAVAIVSGDHPSVRAVVIGDGELRSALESLAGELGIEDNLEFAGQQENVGQWLNRAKVFVLTSDSEGLALSLMEAMTCGLPAVVSNVGDLGSLVEHGLNGFLVGDRTPENFAAGMTTLVADDAMWSQFSAEARDAASHYKISAVSDRWDRILGLSV